MVRPQASLLREAPAQQIFAELVDCLSSHRDRTWLPQAVVGGSQRRLMGSEIGHGIEILWFNALQGRVCARLCCAQLALARRSQRRWTSAASVAALSLVRLSG